MAVGVYVRREALDLGFMRRVQFLTTVEDTGHQKLREAMAQARSSMGGAGPSNLGSEAINTLHRRGLLSQVPSQTIQIKRNRTRFAILNPKVFTPIPPSEVIHQGPQHRPGQRTRS